MPKLKTRKSIVKRVKVTKNGKVMRSHPGRRHLLSCKTSKKRRYLRKKVVITGKYAKNFRACIHQ